MIGSHLEARVVAGRRGQSIAVLEGRACLGEGAMLDEADARRIARLLSALADELAASARPGRILTVTDTPTTETPIR